MLLQTCFNLHKPHHHTPAGVSGPTSSQLQQVVKPQQQIINQCQQQIDKMQMQHLQGEADFQQLTEEILRRELAKIQQRADSLR